MYNQKNVYDLNGEQLLLLQGLKEIKDEMDELLECGEKSEYIKIDVMWFEEARKSFKKGFKFRIYPTETQKELLAKSYRHHPVDCDRIVE